MTLDLFSFWADVPRDARVHPQDRPVINRVKHHFQLDCLPTNWLGPLRSAPVVLLLLSPGFSEEDITHAEMPEVQAYYVRQRSGTANLPSQEEHHSAWVRWTQMVRQFGIQPKDATDRVAILNIAAYKSNKFRDPHLLAALPSSRVAL